MHFSLLEISFSFKILEDISRAGFINGTPFLSAKGISYVGRDIFMYGGLINITLAILPPIPNYSLVDNALCEDFFKYFKKDI